MRGSKGGTNYIQLHHTGNLEFFDNVIKLKSKPRQEQKISQICFNSYNFLFTHLPNVFNFLLFKFFICFFRHLRQHYLISI